MTVEAAVLRELHRIHGQLADVRSRLERGPKQVAAREAQVKQLEAALETARQAVRRAKMASDEKQLQLRSNEDRIADLKKKLNACSSNKEFQALKEQIAADEMANSVLSDEILEGFDKVDELETKVAEAQQALAKGQEELEQVRSRVQSERETLEAEVARLSGELEQAESRLPADFKADYRRVVKNRAENSLAPLEGEYCGGCSQMITPQMFNELRLKQPVFCKSCGVILYLPEEG